MILNDNSGATHQVFNGDCVRALSSLQITADLTFLDPPFNQQKDYALHNDDLPEEDYWTMMRDVCAQVFRLTSAGGALYFMQREKNAERVLRCLRETGWKFQNLIIWKKKTSATPSPLRYGKQYQIIAFATKGERPRVFNRLRIAPPLPANYKYERDNGVFLTDVWDDIRELTSGYFAGDEAIRRDNGERFHKQQSPLALLLRIILTSSKRGDTVLDPFAGTGTTAVVAKQIKRNSVSIEIDPANAALIENRIENPREADCVRKFYKDYACTENLSEIWGESLQIPTSQKVSNGEAALFDV